MEVFGSPYAPVLFIHKAIHLKISFVSKPNAAHMDVKFINRLHYIVSESLFRIHGSRAEGLSSSNFVWIEA